MTLAPHQLQRTARRRAGLPVWGCDAHSLAVDDSQDRPFTRARLADPTIVRRLIPVDGLLGDFLQSPDFLPRRAQLGRRFGVAHFCRCRLARGPQIDRIEPKPRKHCSNPFHLEHLSSVPVPMLNRDTDQRPKSWNTLPVRTAT